MNVLSELLKATEVPAQLEEVCLNISKCCSFHGYSVDTLLKEVESLLIFDFVGLEKECQKEVIVEPIRKVKEKHQEFDEEDEFEEVVYKKKKHDDNKNKNKSKGNKR